MICGDMPVIALRPEGAIVVYPSPWNGKEGLYGDVSAPLGGTIVLEQGECNTIERISPRDAFSAAFSQFACIPDTVQEINVFSSLVDRTLSQYPVWKLRNRGDAAAAAMTRDALASYLSERRQSNDPI